MATVIHNQTVKDMNTFFETNGTEQRSVRSNPEATHLWIKELKEHTALSYDVQPLHLIQKMIRLVPAERLTAPQVVSVILDFKELPNLFCGACCDKSNDSTWTMAEESHWPETAAAISESMAEVDDSTDDESNALIEWEENEHTIQSLPEETDPAAESLELLASTIPDFGQSTAVTPTNQQNWQPPVAEQVDDGVTLRDIYPDEKSILTARQPDETYFSTDKVDGKLDVIEEVSETETTGQAQVQSSRSRSPNGLSTSDTAKESPPSVEPHVAGHFTSFLCQWPSCDGAGLLFDGQESLNAHYRDVHHVHDFAGSHLEAGEVGPYAGQMQKTSDFAGKTAVFLGQSPTPNENANFMALEGPSESQPEGEDRRSAKPKARPKTARFALLPEDRRPKPVISFPEPITVDFEYHEIMPEALEEPPLRGIDGHTGQGPHQPPQAAGGWRIPTSSRVPSYFLASTNRFTGTELDSLIPQARLSSLVPPPLFVYGSLMFPSILRAQAEVFSGLGTEGVYSELHQRRLRTDVSDWKAMSFSIQHAAEQMTPAILKGYDRWRPLGFPCAVIEEAEDSPHICSNYLKSGEDEKCPGQVPGFIVFGLSEEALKCLDHLVSNTELQKRSKEEGIADRHTSLEGPLFTRDRVRVDIGIKGGGSRTTDAMTYVYGNKLARLRYRWDINRFVKSKNFQTLSGGALKKSVVVAEEEKLAEIIGMTLVLGGDVMCDAVLRDDREQLCELLEAGENINAPCRNYGSVLQAVAAEGKPEMLEFLLKKSPDINARGGQYSNALIAATVRGREEIARLLIKAGADVLADGGQYVSALYQAVNFSDPDLAHLLLEKGAWLSRDYQELLDLAGERGNREIIRMLETYDVRNLHLAKSANSERLIGRARYDSDEDSNINSHSSSRDLTRRERARDIQKRSAMTLQRLVLEILVLKGQPGKWTGIKGVRILRVVYPTGVSEEFLAELRPNLRRGYKILDFLKDATMNREDGVDLSMVSPHFIEDTQPAASSSNVDHRPRRYTTSSARESDERRSRQRTNYVSSPCQRLNRFWLILSQDAPRVSTERARAFDVGEDGTFCLSCNGRGGRRGTGRACPGCSGTGKRRVSTGSMPGASSRCRTCNGYGQTFSERDRCRACQNEAWPSAHCPTETVPDYPPPPYASQEWVDRRV